jgi:hypothetical protein
MAALVVARHPEIRRADPPQHRVAVVGAAWMLHDDRAAAIGIHVLDVRGRPGAFDEHVSVRIDSASSMSPAVMP